MGKSYLRRQDFEIGVGHEDADSVVLCAPLQPLSNGKTPVKSPSAAENHPCAGLLHT